MTHPFNTEPYPPVRYTAEGGHAHNHLHAHTAEPDLVFPTGVRVSYLATAARTDGEFGLYRWDFSTERTGPDPHFHRTISESFFVLSGTISLYDGDHWVEATAGDYLYVPPGGIHGFKNDSGQVASMLLLFAPGAAREGYFEGLAAMAKKDLALTDEERSEFYAHHDNVWLGD